MTTTNGTHGANPEMVGLAHLFSTIPKEFGDGVVKKALTGQLQVSGETRAAFRRAVGSYITVAGFRNSELAPPPLLQEPVSHWVRRRNDLASAVLKVWAESQQPLRERVDSYLRQRGLLNGDPDYSAHSISVMHTDPQWDDAIDGLTQQNPDLERDDLVLMSTYISGRVTHMAEDSASDSPSQSSPSPTSEELSGALQQALDLLRTLSPDAPEWEQGVAEFVQSIEEIREKKQADAEAIATLDAEVMSMAQLHEDLLAFFEWSAEEKLKERAYPWADMDAAQALIDKLSGLLKEYAQVHPMAKVRSEELERGPRRTELQQRIDETLAQFGALEVQTPPPPPVVETVDNMPDPSPAQEPPQPLISEEQLASLRAEHERLTQANRSLVSDNNLLREKANQLSSELGESRNLAETWRRSYQESRRSQALVPVEQVPEFGSVDQAVRMAQQKFSDRISFQLNAKSDTSIPFDNPRQMWDALEWLATVYYDAKTGNNAETDLGLSLRQICGWHYTPNQSAVTMGQYREYYEAWVRGRKRELQEHIGTGNGYHRGTVRIAFIWEAEEKKLVIGYIGRHQRTDAS